MIITYFLASKIQFRICSVKLPELRYLIFGIPLFSLFFITQYWVYCDATQAMVQIC